MGLNGTAWTPIGPSPISEGGTNDNGLVSSIAINPNNPSILYIGTVGGGVWRSEDGGGTWTPIFDRELSLGIGEPAAIAIDPNNTPTMYVGTSSRFAPQPQAGLFKSTDGGSSWIALGSGYPAGNVGNAVQFVQQWINVIIVDPADGNVLYLASSFGLFRSTDGGLNWTPGSNGFGDARSLVLDTSTPSGSRILFAGISGRGVFRSHDGGQTWSQVLSGATPAVAAAIGAPPKGFAKVIVAIAPPTKPVPNPAGVQVVYVSLEGTNGAPDPVGVFMSKNQGATWVQQTATGMPTRSQGGYSFHFAVDPASPGDGINDIIYFGAVGQAKSNDSGNSFTGLSGLHADTHSWAFVPRTGLSSVVLCGNDGGIDKSTDAGATWAHLNAGGLQTGLFYNLDIKPDVTGSVTVGALQDNEVETTKGSVGSGWKATQGGDGWDVAYDATNSGQVYCSSGFWSPAPCTRVFVSTDDALTFPKEITPWGTTSDTGCYLAPVTTDPTTGGIVYVSGSQNLWQSRNGGGSWRILAPFNSTGNVDVSAVDGNHVVIAVGNKVFVSTNALAATVGPPTGVVFTDITRNLPSRNVARALLDPSDPTIIYAVLGGFDGSGAGQSGHVFRTTLGGTAWIDVSPVLNIPFNAIALDGSTTPSAIYAGTDFGVLRSVDAGSSWTILDDIHFPRVPVLDLIYRNGILRAATYGRGVFSFAKPAGPSIAIYLDHELDFGVVCKEPKYLNLKIYNVGSKDLVINSVQRLMGSSGFFVLPAPATPVVVEAGEEIEFTVAYNPTLLGILEVATIRISSNDPAAPFVDIAAIGIQGTANLVTAIANSGNIGDACLGSFRDEGLTINNSGSCPLVITSITSSSPEFLAPQLSGPMLVDHGDSTGVWIRFQPASFGTKTATITLFSNDPAGPRTVHVSGTAPSPRLALFMPDSGNFGNCCIGSFKDEPLTLTNGGKCTLTITDVTSSSVEFVVPTVFSYPVTIEPGGNLEIPIRFQPSSFAAKTGTITVISNDPTGPHTIAVHGEVPSGKVVVTGSAYFGGVKCCKRAFRTISVCNLGQCDLHVTHLGLKHENRHWRLVHNPFPATLHAGSCVNVVIRYKATQKEPHPCTLIIKSDDPTKPVLEIEVIAWTRCCCRKCCDDCCKGCCCEERHKECCDEHRNRCCDKGHERDEKDHAESQHNGEDGETYHGRHHPHRHDDEDEQYD